MMAGPEPRTIPVCQCSPVHIKEPHVSIHSRPVRRLTPQPTDRGRADCPSLKGEVTEKDFIGSAVLSTTLFPLKGEVSNHKGIFDKTKTRRAECLPRFCFGRSPLCRRAVPVLAILPGDRQEGLPFDPEETLGRFSLVTKLFFWKLRGSANLCPATVYRSPTNTKLKAKISVEVRLISSP